VIVLLAAGINCDRETAFAFERAGAAADRVHINDLIFGLKSLDDYQILVVPGGFSFGDDIASGKVLANKLKYKLGEAIDEFREREKLILGICNGFQVLAKLGLLPGLEGDHRSQCATVTFNDSGRFEDRWVYLKVNKNSPCIYTQGLESLYLPVRHGEGKFVAEEPILKSLRASAQTVVQYVDERGRFGDYPVNPNGSMDHIAGICDESGRIFGLMPHPEGYIRRTQHPRWTRNELPDEGDGLAIFRNAVEYFG
jgi:phosphoribosylformylglycinamidine synthase